MSKRTRAVVICVVALLVLSVGLVCTLVVLPTLFGKAPSKDTPSGNVTEQNAPESTTYTLSEKSCAIAKGVTEDLDILVFLAEEYFTHPDLEIDEFNTLMRNFHTFTKEFHALSNGKITTTYLDVETDPTLLATYTDYNVEYGSILFRCGEQSHVLNVENLYSYEYDSYSQDYVYSSRVEEVLSSTINLICSGKTVTITFLTGHGEDTTLIEDMSSLYQLYGYLTETVNFTANQTINETTQMLVIAAPDADYSLGEIARLRQWLHNDGNLNRNLFVLCNYALGDDSNLYDFLEDDYGITVTENLIVETDSSKYMNITGGEYQPLTLMNATDLTDSSGTVVMPYTLQLELKYDSDPAASGVGNVPLIEFSDDAELVEAESITEGKAKVQKATDDDVIGMAYAVETNGTVANHIIVSGSFQFPSYNSIAMFDNEELMLEPVLATCAP